MPERANILGEFLSAIEGLVERPRPAARQPMRAPSGAGPQAGPDLEAARRAAGPARASAEGEVAVGAALRPERTNALRQSLQTPEARASIAGHAAVAQEFEALISQAQRNPEPRYRGELRPEIQSPPPGAPPPQPPTGLQNAPLSTQQLQTAMQQGGARRTPPVQVPGQPGSGRFVAGQRVPSQNLAPRTNPPTTAASPGQLTTRNSAAGRARAARDRANAQESARNSMASLSPEARAALRADPAGRVREAGGRLPTPAQTTTRSVLNRLLPQPQRQPITPSRATQPQTGGTSTRTPQSVWDVPNTRQFFDTHLRNQLGMSPQEFEQYYFAGFARNPSVSVAGNNLHLDASVRAPQDMIAPGRNGGPEVRIPAGTYLGTIRRQIMPQQREVYNAYFALDSQYQGLGIARTVFKNQIDVYRRMGNIDRVTVSAGLDGGGHTWARFGFVPTLSTWQGLRTTLLSRLRGITNIPPAQRAIAEQLIRADDPYAIRELSGLPMAPGGRSSDLGRRLLGGTGWRGTLDLRNPRDMDWFDAYVTPRPRQ